MLDAGCSPLTIRQLANWPTHQLSCLPPDLRLEDRFFIAGADSFYQRFIWVAGGKQTNLFGIFYFRKKFDEKRRDTEIAVHIFGKEVQLIII